MLDYAMGSGSTGVACANTGRSFIGIEINRTFFEVAEERIKSIGYSDHLPLKSPPDSDITNRLFEHPREKALEEELTKREQTKESKE